MDPSVKRIKNERDYVWIFEEVPKEIKLHILSWLDLKSVNSCALVSKQFYKYSVDNQIWIHLCEKHWWSENPSVIEAQMDTKFKNIFSWKQYFIEKYLLNVAKPEITFSPSIFPSCVNPRYRHSCASLAVPNSSKGQIVIIGGTGASSDVTFGDVHRIDIEQQPSPSNATVLVKGLKDIFQKLSASPGERELKPSWSGAINMANAELAVKVFPLNQWKTRPTDYKSTRNFACAIGSKIWVWGGSHSFPPVKSNDLYTLEIESQQWDKIEARGTPPSARSDHCGAVVGKEFFIIGGSDATVTPLGDVHKFNTETLEWTTIESKGTGPSPRSGHTCSALGSKIYVYGGAVWDSKDRMWKSKSNETFVFDTLTNTWTKPKITGDVPAVSTFAASIAIGNHIWLIGGGSKECDYVSDTIYALDTISLNWQKVPIRGSFLAKDCISATAAGDKVYLFGGFRGEPVNEFQCIDMQWLTKLKRSVKASI